MAADTPPAIVSPIGVEVDGDPAAFFIDGFSLHVAVTGPWRRLDLGVYAIDEPKLIYGQDGWRTELRAWGLGWEAVGGLGPGFFAGVTAQLAVRTYIHEASETVVERHQLFVGPHIGYRIMLGDHFYLAPWLAVLYAYRGDEVTVAGDRFDDVPYVIFPTVYAGWKF
jgi:hypothetical protein